MGVFDSGRDLLAQAFAIAGETVTYLRGGTVIASGVAAKVGRTLFRTEDAYGVTIRVESRDYLVQAASLEVTPQVGDTIQQGGDAYTVSAPSSEPCWRWHDRGGMILRIHTQYDGEVEE